jgi:sec-independent protein translocase protein TatA
MSEILLFGMPQGAEWLVILVAVLLLFGGSRLPQLAKALGQSKKAFKEGLDEAEEESRRDKAAKAVAEPNPSLSALDDEALFEEARRRARLRAAEAHNIPAENLLPEKSTADQKR